MSGRFTLHNHLHSQCPPAPVTHTHGWKRYWTKLSIHLCHWRRLILILLIKWEFYFLLYFWRCSITTPRSFKRIHIRAAKLFFFGGSRVSLRATMTRLSSATKGQRRRSCRIPFGSPQLAVLRQFTQDNDKVTGASCNTTQKIWKRKNKTSGLFLLRLAKLIWVDVVTIVVDKKTKIKFRFFVDLFLDFLFLLWWIGNRKNGAVSKDIPKTLLTFDCRLL